MLMLLVWGTRFENPAYLVANYHLEAMESLISRKRFVFGVRRVQKKLGALKVKSGIGRTLAEGEGRRLGKALRARAASSWHGFFWVTASLLSPLSPILLSPE